MIKRHNTFDATIKVIDSIMGSGKTQYAIQMMNEADTNTHFIYVTPYLEEVIRIQRDVTNREFKQPIVGRKETTKLRSLKRLISEGADIATTHALFSMADDELLQLLEWNNYVLVLDEVMEVIKQIETKKNDFQLLLDAKWIEIHANGKIHWIADSEVDTKYNNLKSYALTGNLYSFKNMAFIWQYPCKMFKNFQEIYILTYLFTGQIQRYYYDLHDIKYKYFGVKKDSNDRYHLNPKSEIVEDRAKFKNLINIYEGRLNDVGNKKTALSSSWFSNKYNKDNVNVLRKNLKNYFTNITKSNSDDFMWTCYDAYKNKLKGKGYMLGTSDKDLEKNVIGCYTAFNLRATNDYSCKKVLAFCINRYMNPVESSFFREKNITVDEDMLALSDLLQWLYRSGVRCENPSTIQVYIPSRRMRELLDKWLNDEI